VLLQGKIKRACIQIQGLQNKIYMRFLVKRRNPFTSSREHYGMGASGSGKKSSPRIFAEKLCLTQEDCDLEKRNVKYLHFLASVAQNMHKQYDYIK
jgi:hypothetical protein